MARTVAPVRPGRNWGFTFLCPPLEFFDTPVAYFSMMCHARHICCARGCMKDPVLCDGTGSFIWLNMGSGKLSEQELQQSS
jgi:hypothetical protein